MSYISFDDLVSYRAEQVVAVVLQKLGVNEITVDDHDLYKSPSLKVTYHPGAMTRKFEVIKETNQKGNSE